MSLLALEDQVDKTGRPLDVKKPRGFMVALMVPKEEEEAVATSGGWRAENGRTWSDPLHVTLCYIKNADDDFERVVDVVRKVAAQFPSFPLVSTRANFFFNPDATVHYVGAAAPELEALVAQIRVALDREGIPHDESHPLFVPHITIEYLPPTAPSDSIRDRLIASMQAQPAKFVPTLSIVDDDARTDVPWSTTAAGPALGEPTMPMGEEPSELAAMEARVMEVAAGDNNPTTGKSNLHKHMVRAVYQSLRKNGEADKNAAKGAFKITTSQLQKYGYQGKGDAGRLTGKGGNRSRSHAQEPAGAVASKARDYDQIKKVASQ